MFRRLLPAGMALAIALGGPAAFANTTTPNLGLNKPSVGADSDTWGTYLNQNADKIDALFSSGTWTPVVTFATPGNLSVSYSQQSGRYTQIGDLVYVDVTLAFIPTFTTASGDLIITGLPIAANASNLANMGGMATISQGFPGLVTGSLSSALESTTSLMVRSDDPANGVYRLTASHVASGVTVSITMSLIYKK